MIVCVCRRITDQQIRQAAAAGAYSLECLQFDLGVATQCGRCADCASKVLCDARNAHGGARSAQPIAILRGSALLPRPATPDSRSIAAAMA